METLFTFPCACTTLIVGTDGLDMHTYACASLTPVLAPVVVVVLISLLCAQHPCLRLSASPLVLWGISSPYFTVMDLALEEAFDYAIGLKETSRRYSRLLNESTPTYIRSSQREKSHVLPPSMQLAFQQTMRIILRFNLRAAEVKRKKYEGFHPTTIVNEADSLFLDTYSQLL